MSVKVCAPPTIYSQTPFLGRITCWQEFAGRGVAVVLRGWVLLGFGLASILDAARGMN